jgi:hypothetical protein
VKTRTDFIKTVDDLSAELNGKLILIFDWPFLLDYVKRNGIEKNYGMLGVGLKKSIGRCLCVCTQEALFEWRGGSHPGAIWLFFRWKKRTWRNNLDATVEEGFYLSITFEGTICHSAFFFFK